MELRDRLPPLEFGTEDLELADLDGDGGLELLVTVPARVYRYSDQDGYAEIPDAIAPIPSVLSWEAEIGDVSGDGIPDCVLISPISEFLLSGDGTGAFSPVDGGLPGLGVASAIKLADLDLDGDLDAVVGSQGTDRALLNQGGLFVIASDLPAGEATTTSDLRIGDVDLDGSPDVVRAKQAASDAFELLLQDGALGFTLVMSSFTTPGSATDSLALDDFDGDGDLDLLAGRSTGLAQDLLFAGDGNGGFLKVLGFPGSDEWTTDLVVVDYDGDSDLDVIGSSGGPIFLPDNSRRPLVLYENQGGLVFDKLDPDLGPGLPTECAAAGDVDGDGDVDFLLGGAGPDRLVLQSAEGAFVDATFPWPRTEAGGDFVLGDWNGDGWVDAVTLSDNGLELVINNQGVELVVQPSPAIDEVPSNGGGALVTGDFNGDGALDLLVLLELAFARLLEGDGAGGFTWNTASIPPFLSGNEAVAGDLNNDGHLDVYVDGDLVDLVLINDGAGSLVPVDAPGSNPTRNIALGDLDGDGDLDAYRGTSSGSSASVSDSWLRNQTENPFASELFSPLVQAVDAVNTLDVALFDRDLDGDLDVLGTGFPDVSLLDNDGAGNFVRVDQDVIGVAGDFLAILPLDADADGDQDVFLAGRSNAVDLLLQNDGAGVLTAVPEATHSALVETPHAAAVDWDRDGDVDVLLGSSGMLRPLSNVSRELARRGPARLGKPLVLDVFGPAGTPWALAFAAGFTELDLGDLGLLRLDPGSLQLLSVGLLGGEDGAEVEAPFPADPALLGLELGSQAVVGAPPRFTNAELLEVTSL